MKMTDPDLQFIEEAATFFVNPGLVAKGLAVIGQPIEKLSEKLPERVQQTISMATKKAVEKALLTAVSSIPPEVRVPGNEKSDSMMSAWIHKGTTTMTGAIGGFFGLPALPIELPVTTVVILRGILDQAKVYGHNLQDLETRLECLMVFTLGTASPDDDATETSYFTSRIAVAQSVRKAAEFVAGLSAKELLHALEKGISPAIVRLVSQVAQALEIRVTQKLLGEMIPFVGAAGGSAINYAFTDFYCTAARYHFGVRALEKKYGEDSVQELMKEKIARLKAKPAS